ncbi:hypothetical protein KIPB_002471 [Kipferlia bialata]|uniref:Uncharacterized protein n=1 Tax=Kipferlia bialata TaxID=797122 RepID=A0A9K3GGN9_9EUKA|nr:hypothetical protein KIPB_002471 [Kipferlia bialata]|eukprot:g2471.t1
MDTGEQERESLCTCALFSVDGAGDADLDYAVDKMRSGIVPRLVVAEYASVLDFLWNSPYPSITVVKDELQKGEQPTLSQRLAVLSDYIKYFAYDHAPTKYQKNRPQWTNPKGKSSPAFKPAHRPVTVVDAATLTETDERLPPFATTGIDLVVLLNGWDLTERDRPVAEGEGEVDAEALAKERERERQAEMDTPGAERERVCKAWVASKLVLSGHIRIKGAGSAPVQTEGEVPRVHAVERACEVLQEVEGALTSVVQCERPALPPAPEAEGEGETEEDVAQREEQARVAYGDAITGLLVSTICRLLLTAAVYKPWLEKHKVASLSAPSPVPLQLMSTVYVDSNQEKERERAALAKEAPKETPLGKLVVETPLPLPLRKAACVPIDPIVVPAGEESPTPTLEYYAERLGMFPPCLQTVPVVLDSLLEQVTSLFEPTHPHSVELARLGGEAAKLEDKERERRDKAAEKEKEREAAKKGKKGKGKGKGKADEEAEKEGEGEEEAEDRQLEEVLCESERQHLRASLSWCLSTSAEVANGDAPTASPALEAGCACTDTEEEGEGRCVTPPSHPLNDPLNGLFAPNTDTHACLSLPLSTGVDVEMEAVWGRISSSICRWEYTHSVAPMLKAEALTRQDMEESEGDSDEESEGESRQGTAESSVSAQSVGLRSRGASRASRASSRGSRGSRRVYSRECDTPYSDGSEGEMVEEGADVGIIRHLLNRASEEHADSYVFTVPLGEEGMGVESLLHALYISRTCRIQALSAPVKGAKSAEASVIAAGGEDGQPDRLFVRHGPNVTEGSMWAVSPLSSTVPYERVTIAFVPTLSGFATHKGVVEAVSYIQQRALANSRDGLLAPRIESISVDSLPTPIPRRSVPLSTAVDPFMEEGSDKTMQKLREVDELSHALYPSPAYRKPVYTTDNLYLCNAEEREREGARDTRRGTMKMGLVRTVGGKWSRDKDTTKGVPVVGETVEMLVSRRVTHSLTRIEREKENDGSETDRHTRESRAEEAERDRERDEQQPIDVHIPAICPALDYAPADMAPYSIQLHMSHLMCHPNEGSVHVKCDRNPVGVLDPLFGSGTLSVTPVQWERRLVGYTQAPDMGEAEAEGEGGKGENDEVPFRSTLDSLGGLDIPEGAHSGRGDSRASSRGGTSRADAKTRRRHAALMLLRQQKLDKYKSAAKRATDMRNARTESVPKAGTPVVGSRPSCASMVTSLSSGEQVHLDACGTRISLHSQGNAVTMCERVPVQSSPSLLQSSLSPVDPEAGAVPTTLEFTTTYLFPSFPIGGTGFVPPLTSSDMTHPLRLAYLMLTEARRESVTEKVADAEATKEGEAEGEKEGEEERRETEEGSDCSVDRVTGDLRLSVAVRPGSYTVYAALTSCTTRTGDVVSVAQGKSMLVCSMSTGGDMTLHRGVYSDLYSKVYTKGASLPQYVTVSGTDSIVRGAEGGEELGSVPCSTNFYPKHNRYIKSRADGFEASTELKTALARSPSAQVVERDGNQDGSVPQTPEGELMCMERQLSAIYHSQGLLSSAALDSHFPVKTSYSMPLFARVSKCNDIPIQFPSSIADKFGTPTDDIESRFTVFESFDGSCVIYDLVRGSAQHVVAGVSKHVFYGDQIVGPVLLTGQNGFVMPVSVTIPESEYDAPPMNIPVSARERGTSLQQQREKERAKDRTVVVGLYAPDGHGFRRESVLGDAANELSMLELAERCHKQVTEQVLNLPNSLKQADDTTNPSSPRSGVPTGPGTPLLRDNALEGPKAAFKVVSRAASVASKVLSRAASVAGSRYNLDSSCDPYTRYEVNHSDNSYICTDRSRAQPLFDVYRVTMASDIAKKFVPSVSLATTLSATEGSYDNVISMNSLYIELGNPIPGNEVKAIHPNPLFHSLDEYGKYLTPEKALAWRQDQVRDRDRERFPDHFGGVPSPSAVTGHVANPFANKVDGAAYENQILCAMISEQELTGHPLSYGQMETRVTEAAHFNFNQRLTKADRVEYANDYLLRGVSSIGLDHLLKHHIVCGTFNQALHPVVYSIGAEALRAYAATLEGSTSPLPPCAPVMHVSGYDYERWEEVAELAGCAKQRVLTESGDAVITYSTGSCRKQPSTEKRFSTRLSPSVPLSLAVVSTAAGPASYIPHAAVMPIVESVRAVGHPFRLQVPQERGEGPPPPRVLVSVVQEMAGEPEYGVDIDSASEGESVGELEDESGGEGIPGVETPTVSTEDASRVYPTSLVIETEVSVPSVPNEVSSGETSSASSAEGVSKVPCFWDTELGRAWTQGGAEGWNQGEAEREKQRESITVQCRQLPQRLERPQLTANLAREKARIERKRALPRYLPPLRDARTRQMSTSHRSRRQSREAGTMRPELSARQLDQSIQSMRQRETDRGREGEGYGFDLPGNQLHGQLGSTNPLLSREVERQVEREREQTAEGEREGTSGPVAYGRRDSQLKSLTQVSMRNSVPFACPNAAFLRAEGDNIRTTRISSLCRIEQSNPGLLTRVFEPHPTSVQLGRIPAGFSFLYTLRLKNVGVEPARLGIRPFTGEVPGRVKVTVVKRNMGLIAVGMSCTAVLRIDIPAMAAPPRDHLAEEVYRLDDVPEPCYDIECAVEVMTERELLSVPITGVVYKPVEGFDIETAELTNGVRLVRQ